MSSQNARRTIAVTVLVLLLIGFVDVRPCEAAVHVRGYYRKNGTYVRPHYRSSPDGNPYNNWSYPGNVNPYTGKVAPGNPDTYLRNYYHRSPQSSIPTTPAGSPQPTERPTPAPASGGPASTAAVPNIVSAAICTAAVTDAWSTAAPVRILSASVRTIGLRLSLSKPAAEPVQCSWYHIQDGRPVAVNKATNEKTGYDLYYFTITFPQGTPATAGQWRVEAHTGTTSVSVPFFVAPSTGQPDTLRLVIDGKETGGETPVMLWDGKAYVRVGALADAVGLQEDWMPSLEMSVVRSSQREVIMKAGWVKAAIDGIETKLASAPMMVNDAMYVPVDIIQVLFGRKATFDAERGCVTVSGVEGAPSAPK